MIISHKYRFIFIKTEKTAGTSIEVFLSQHCDEGDVVTPIYPHVEPHSARNFTGLWNPLRELIENQGNGFRAVARDVLRRPKFYNHMSARSVRARVRREIWNEYFKFCVERNPWDKTISHYHMLNRRAGGTLTLDDYLERRQFCFNFPKYTDVAGSNIVNKVVRYESLKEGLSDIFQTLGIPFDGTLGVRAKSGYRGDRRPYNEFLTARQRDLIGKAFHREISIHGFSY